MKATVVQEFGPPAVLVLREVPTPAPAAGQILIRVEAAAVNFADVMRRRNDVYPFPTSLPFIPGSEVAGTVEALGDGVDGPPIGTAVFALVGVDGSTGYAQYAVADAQQVIPIPPGLSADEASAFVVAGSAALLCLVEVGQLAERETVLIGGASGGMGGYAIQIAKLLGATVVAAASSTTRREAALANGADHVVDYTADGWADQVRALTGGRGVDLVIEIAGGKTFAESLSALAPFGRVVIAGRASGQPLSLDEQTIRSIFYSPALNQSLRVFNLGLWFGLRPEASIQALQRLVGYVASGQVKVNIGHVLPLGEAAQAHQLIEDRQSTGKVILKPWA